MRYMSGNFVVIGVSFLLPLYLYAQEISPAKTEPGAPERKADGSEQQTRSQKELSTQSPEMTKQSGQTMISVQSLINSKVLDQQNKEIGTVRSLMLDPETGRLVRADITLGAGGLLGITSGEQRLSVPWEQLSVKRQEEKLVLVMNQEVVEKIRTDQTKQAAKRNNNEKQQERGQGASGAKGAGAAPERAQPPASQSESAPGTSQQATSAGDIKKAEEALKAKGLNPGPIDGKMDSETQEALREFQKQNKLAVTGSLDEQTAEKLGVKLAEGKTPSGARPGKESSMPQSKGSVPQGGVK